VIKIGIISNSRLDTRIQTGNVCNKAVFESLKEITPVEVAGDPLYERADFRRDLTAPRIQTFGKFTLICATGVNEKL